MKVTKDEVRMGADLLCDFLNGKRIDHAQQFLDLFSPLDDWRELPPNSLRSSFFAVPGKREFRLGAALALTETGKCVEDRRNLFSQYGADGSLCVLVTVLANYSGKSCLYVPSVVLPTGVVRGYRACGIKDCDVKALPISRDGYLGDVKNELKRLSKI